MREEACPAYVIIFIMHLRTLCHNFAMIRNSKFIRLQFQILTGIDSDPRSPVVFDQRRDRDHETASRRSPFGCPSWRFPSSPSSPLHSSSSPSSPYLNANSFGLTTFLRLEGLTHSPSSVYLSVGRPYHTILTVTAWRFEGLCARARVHSSFSDRRSFVCTYIPCARGCAQPCPLTNRGGERVRRLRVDCPLYDDTD